MAADPKCNETSSESKSASLEIVTPIEANFLSHFNENQSNVDLLERLRTKYGATKLSELDDANPLVMERIIHALTSRGREDEIFIMIERYMDIFDDLDLGNILNIKLKNESLLYESWPVYIHGHDRMGHPVFYDEVSGADAATILKVFQSAADGDSESDLLRITRLFRFKLYAKVTRQKQIYSQRYSTTILKHILVHDCRDFSFIQFATNFNFYAKVAKTVMTDEQLMFPETLYKLYMVNVPPAFMIVWKVVSSVIDARVLEKIKLLGTDFLDEMLKDIDIEQIPQRYGGKAKWKVRWGDVPDMDVEDSNNSLDATDSEEDMEYDDDMVYEI